ncbi:MAG: hypothetical protein U1B78_00915, partial [Dehalococcoidia bacterium]|nr:hypothetical protein [Dehalococcoidia bacterium]
MADVARTGSAIGHVEDRPATGGAQELSAGEPWRRRHLLDLDDFSAGEIELVLQTADAMKEVLARDVPRVPALRGTTIISCLNLIRRYLYPPPRPASGLLPLPVGAGAVMAIPRGKPCAGLQSSGN